MTASTNQHSPNIWIVFNPFLSAVCWLRTVAIRAAWHRKISNDVLEYNAILHCFEYKNYLISPLNNYMLFSTSFFDASVSGSFWQIYRDLHTFEREKTYPPPSFSACCSLLICFCKPHTHAQFALQVEPHPPLTRFFPLPWFFDHQQHMRTGLRQAWVTMISAIQFPNS